MNDSIFYWVVGQGCRINATQWMMQSHTQLRVYILLSISEVVSAWPGSYSCSVYGAQMKHTTLFPSPHTQIHTLFLASAKNHSHQMLPIKSQTTPVEWQGHQTSLWLSFITTVSTTGWVKMLLPYYLACAEIVWNTATIDLTSSEDKVITLLIN